MRYKLAKPADGRLDHPICAFGGPEEDVRLHCAVILPVTTPSEVIADVIAGLNFAHERGLLEHEKTFPCVSTCGCGGEERHAADCKQARGWPGSLRSCCSSQVGLPHSPWCADRATAEEAS